MFKKVIGQDNTPPAQPAPRAPEPAPAQTPPPTYGAQPQAAAAPARTWPAATRNVLSTDVEIKGTVKFTNDLVVDGKIEGEITSDGNLTIGGATSQVLANIISQLILGLPREVDPDRGKPWQDSCVRSN